MKVSAIVLLSAAAVTVAHKDHFAVHKRQVDGYGAAPAYEYDTPAGAPDAVSSLATQATWTSTASDWSPATVASAPAYGSGSMPKAGNSWDSCMAQCQAACGSGNSDSMAWPAQATATYAAGGGSAMSAPYATPSAMPASNASTPLMPGPGEVIVAPQQGDLRFVPFNIVAEPGSTITFKFGGGPHTVTKSSLSTPCQLNTDKSFDSGKQMGGFQWEMKVDSKETIAYFCTVGKHCSGSGMFGLINAQVSLESVNNTMGAWMASKEAQNDPKFVDEWNATMTVCKGTEAEKWGEGIAMDQIPQDQRYWAAYNVLATRKFFAETPGSLAFSRGEVPSNSPDSPIPTAVASDAATEPSASAESLSSDGVSNSTSLFALSILVALVGLFLLA